jgi:hypothetical protein
MIKSMVYRTTKYAINEDVEDYTKEIGVYHIWNYYMDMKSTGGFDTFILLDEEFHLSNEEEMTEFQKYLSRFIQVLKREYSIEMYDENIKAVFEHQIKNRTLKISVKEL